MLIKLNVTRSQLFFRLPTIIGVSSALLLSSIAAANDSKQDDCYRLFTATKYQEARDQCQELAELGDAKGAFLLATMYYQALGTERDDQRGIFWDQVAAEKGHPESAYRLGLAYQLGQGVSQSNSQARHWYQQAALAQHAKAQKLLGSMFESGAAGEKDQQRAYQWYLKAAQQGVMGAQLKVGTMLLEGRGVKANRASAQHWIRKAAEAGNSNAQVAMGVILAEVDPDESLSWYQQSADQGNGLALQNLALVYYAGQGVDADHEKAAALAQQALDAGNTEAASLLNLIRLETEQKKVVELQAEKQQLARQIRESIPDNGSGEQQLLLATLSVEDEPSETDIKDAPPVLSDKPLPIALPVETPVEPPAASASTTTTAALEQESSQPVANVATAETQATPWQPDNQYALADGWVMDKLPPNFTIQLLYGTDERGVLKYIAKHKLPDTVRYFRTQREAGLYYVLVYGDYESIPEARAALAEIPASARKSHWIRKFRRLQELYVAP
ncbi:SPOR domain-containing protein [Amphritea sp. 2_MG-2023]|uniref:SPOR domain-containing protein n=1 Tax=Amphritea TaxID=515417 RepID=UPI001C06CA72|nr:MULTISPECIES: SPOR domain-containing protein [Amphritea]MBU2965339.1 SEL1-like repeat protein [Amphritea atlantica]MDO6419984.1 SPOR domain-containing protein [Amphritea sp. 2_MG-2023]